MSGAAPRGLAGFAFETQRHVLLTPNLMLRPPRRADFHAWSSLRRANRAFLNEYEAGWKEEELNRRNFQARLLQIRAQMQRGEGYSFLIIRRADGRLMGGIVLYDVRRGELETCTAGAWMGEEFAMQGHMKEAMRALVPYAFRVLGLTRMEADSQTRNERAIRVLEAVGFRREGVARRMRWQNGEWRDHLRLACIAPEREAAGEQPADQVRTRDAPDPCGASHAPAAQPARKTAAARRRTLP
jgi:ribosomal-protein-alanine N-acetyltransferase